MLETALAGERGGVVVVEGGAGVGKTAFLGALRGQGATSGPRVLTATGGELEGGFPFGVVRQLFDPIARGMGDDLEGPARHAAAALGLIAGDHPAETTTHETLHGLYWLVAELAEERPLLLLIDDAHWADPPSVEYLEYLARRAEDLPLGLVIAIRPEEPGTDLGPIHRVGRLPHACTLRLGELGPGSVARLVKDQLGSGADEAFCRACHRATAGNPFLLHELLAELVAEGILPTAEQAARVAQATPDAVLRTVLVRLAALPEPAGRLAEALAVLGHARLPQAAGLAGLDLPSAAEAEQTLLAASIVRHADDALAFAHPLVREVIYSDLSPGRRAMDHARAAALLLDEAVPAEEIVPHLIASDGTGEPWRVEALREAARVARERGAPSAAVTALRRVLEESPTAGDDTEVLAELGIAEMAVIDPQAVEHLRRAIESSDDPNRRGELAPILARARWDLLADSSGALAVLERALEPREALRPELVVALEGNALSIARVHPESRGRAEARLGDLRDADPPEGPTAAPLLANLALYALESTEPADVVADYAGRALADPGSFFLQSYWTFPYAANALTWIDRVDTARAAWDAALQEARRGGSVQLQGFALGWRVHLLTRIGELAEAEAEVEATLKLVGDLRELPPHYLAAGASYLADLQLDRGLETAEPLLEAADPDLLAMLHSSRSRVAYFRGRFEEARDAALTCGEMLAWGGGREAPSIIPWRSEAALAMAALGEREEAGRLASEELELARKQEVPRAIGMSLRALGIIEDPGIDRLEEAVEVLETSPSRIELARALIDLGMALRRARKRAAARERLTRGMDLAHRCGATVLEERAREELLATGARPRRRAVTGVEALTPAELRVARLAAEGKTNREIAQGLFVSMSTVATHLNHAYQKLQIEGRDQLADAL